MMVRAVPEPDGLEHAASLLADLAPAAVGMQQQRGLDVLSGGQRVDQIVGLEDVADLPADGLQHTRPGIPQLLSQHPQAALLGRAQRAARVRSVVLPEPDGPAAIPASIWRRRLNRHAPLPFPRRGGRGCF
jgi:hypothetical protein